MITVLSAIGAFIMMWLLFSDSAVPTIDVEREMAKKIAEAKERDSDSV